MAIVTEISWDDMLDGKPLPEHPARQAWREAVAAIAEKARAKLPECAGRIESAVKTALNGDVELLADGTAHVASQSNGNTMYHVVNGHCNCKDFAKAPYNLCKHRLSAAITRRAQELTKVKLADTNDKAEPSRQPVPAQPDAPTVPLPEAPVSITLKATLHGQEVMVTLRGTDFASVKAQVEQASEWLSVQAPAQPPTQPPAQGTTPLAHDESPYCHAHQAVLKRYERNGQVWYSHKTADGRWCRGQ
jgi:hypothetical protein